MYRFSAFFMTLLLLATFLTSLAADPPSGDPPLTIDRVALAEFLEKKGLSLDRFHFDLDYLDTMPVQNFAHYNHPKRENGKLPLYLDIQKDPVTFPERMQDIAARCARSLPDLFAVADETLGRPARKVELGPPEPVTDLPERVAGAVGRILAAMKTKDPATIAGTVLEVKSDLVHTGVFERDGLSIFFDGDQVHKFDAPTMNTVSVLIDLQGNDRYEGHVAATQGGIAMVFDFAGDDVYEAEGQFAQAAAVGGTALLYDAAGNDRYILGGAGQAFAKEGIAALVDVAGNDTYEITNAGQGFAQPGGFAILLDYAGNDSYTGRDPLNGHPVTVPSPQDPKHNSNMVQGAGQGQNQEPMRAGGVGILLDCSGDDTYRSGCWSQGVGYFMGLGALIDLAGNDTYESWVYVMGSGAHGGFGLLLDRRGDDTYNVAGWNCLGMAVDFGMGMCLDGAGNDRYNGPQSGCGRSIGLGIALFQDSAGDDVYTPKDGKLGFGQFYEKEDYNSDGQVTPPEKMHWGIFLDLAGVDRYPKEYRNGSRWDPAQYSGGLDRPSPANPLIARAGIADWENRDLAEVFAALKKVAPAPEDLKLLAEFGFEHGFTKDASEALFRAGGKVEGATYDPGLRLWVPEADRPWVAKLAEVRARLARAKVEELAAARPIEGPAWVQAECRAIVAVLVQERRAGALLRLARWTTALKPLVERRAALDEARAKDEKKLAALWGARRQVVVKADAAARDAARELDALDPSWRAEVPLASNLAEENVTLDNFTLNEVERAALLRAGAVAKANAAWKDGAARRLAEAVNDLRAMYGRGAVELDAALCKAAAAGAQEGKEAKPDAVRAAERARAAGFDGEVGETAVPAKGGGGASASGLLEGADRGVLLDPKWTGIGSAAGAGGGARLVLGKRK